MNQCAQDMKDHLSRYGLAVQEAEGLSERARELRARLDDARTANLDGMPHHASFSTDRIGRMLGQIEELEERAQAAWDNAAGVYDELQAEIDTLTVPNQRTVLCARYLDLLTWERVNAVLFGNREDFERRTDSFLRQTFKLHGMALAELATQREEKENE